MWAAKLSLTPARTQSLRLVEASLARAAIVHEDSDVREDRHIYGKVTLMHVKVMQGHLHV